MVHQLRRLDTNVREYGRKLNRVGTSLPLHLALLSACSGAGLDAPDAPQGMPFDGAVLVAADRPADEGTDGPGLLDSHPDAASDPVDDAGFTPPDPTTAAPPLDPVGLSAFADSVRFLIDGPSAVQRDIMPGALADARLAVIRGRVHTRDGAPLAQVEVTAVGAPELGRTWSRTDGAFDIVVNGGGLVRLNFSRAGLLPAHREVMTTWNGYAHAQPVVLIELDGNASVIQLSSTTTVATARATTSIDADGARTPTVLVRAGTRATMRLPDGRTEVLDTLTIRATEYTVGPSGRDAMPATLPTASGYTHAVELSVDEALARGAERVTFSQPVFYYLENFLRFPTGEAVPSGFYDRSEARWVASDNGRVIAILGVTSGLADIDLDGDGAAETRDQLMLLELDEHERRRLAELYRPGTTLWRVPIAHFTPWDCNWPYGPPLGAGWPPRLRIDMGVPDPCEKQGSIIECETQVLGQDVPIAGTPLALRYRSRNVAGGHPHRREIPITGAEVPRDAVAVVVQLYVAGRLIEQILPPQPNQIATIDWDGRDAYGRVVNGHVPALLRIGFQYLPVYYGVGAGFDRAFAALGTPRQVSVGVTGSRVENRVVLWRDVDLTFANLDVTQHGAGGWILAPEAWAQTVPSGHAVIASDGTMSSLRWASTFASEHAAAEEAVDPDEVPLADATFGALLAADLGPDGSFYFLTAWRGPGSLVDVPGVIRRLRPDGVVERVAGGGRDRNARRGRDAAFSQFAHFSVTPGGDLYVMDHTRFMRIRPDGSAQQFAVPPMGTLCPASSSNDTRRNSVVVTDDGTAYYDCNFPVLVQNSLTHRSEIWSRSPDGTVRVVVGGGDAPFAEGAPARGLGASSQVVRTPVRSLDPSVLLYFIETEHLRSALRGVAMDGSVFTIASNESGPSYEFPRTVASYSGLSALSMPYCLVIDQVQPLADGSFYINGYNGCINVVHLTRFFGRIRAGRFEWIQGGYGEVGSADEGLPAHLLVSPSGRRFTGPLQYWDGTRAATGFEILDAATQPRCASFLPTPGGRHYQCFDVRGALRAIFSGLGRRELLRLERDAAGRMTSAVDEYARETRVERDASGRIEAIVGPYDHRTTVTYDAQGLLETITHPDGAVERFEYGPDGLMRLRTDARMQTTHYDFEPGTGRLIKVTDPSGAIQSLHRTDTTDSATVTVTTPLGVTTSYGLTTSADGSGSRRARQADGVGAMRQTQMGSRVEQRHSDGTTTTFEVARVRDGRYDIEQLARLVGETPSGVRSEFASTRSTARTIDGTPSRRDESVTIDGRTHRRSYDHATRTWTTVSAAGRVSQMTVDAHDRVAELFVPGFEPIVYHRDAHGRLETVVQGARRWALTYDGASNVHTITDPLARTSTFAYDLVGRAEGILRPDGTQVTFGYDAEGALERVTPPGRPDHTFVFDDRGEPEEVHAPPLPGVSSLTRVRIDADRNMEEVTRPSGEVTGWDYDGLGRLRTATVAGARYRIHYDRESRIDRVEGPAGADQVSLGFDHDGPLLRSESWSGAVVGSVENQYGPGGLPSVRISAGRRLSYGYDDDRILTQAGPVTLVRDVHNGRWDGVVHQQLRTAHHWTSHGELWASTASIAGARIFRWTTTRDLLGRIETESDGAVTWRYLYTPNGALETVFRDGLQVAFYAYDDNGNRLSEATPAGGVTIGAYDDQDRLEAYGALDFGYDADGDMISRLDTASGDLTRYTYDGRGALTEVDMPTRTVGYVIDPAGRRVARSVDGVRTHAWLYDGGRPAVELGPAGVVRAEFVYGFDQVAPIAIIRGGIEYAVITDARGSVRRVVDARTGAVAQALDYDPFGRILADSNPGFQPFGFAGGLYDPDTGLVHFGAREYMPEIGRWTQKDPLGFAAGDPSLYVYAFSDPVNLIDPTGEIVVLPFVVAAWAVAEFGLSAADLMATLSDLIDPCLSDGDKALAFTLFMGGMVLPGGGGAAANHLTRAQARNLAKIQNILTHNAKPGDFTGVALELAGKPIPKPGGGFWDHVTEMRQSVVGLEKSIEGLKGSLQNPSMTEETRGVIEAGIGTAEAVLVRMRSVLGGGTP